MMNQKSSALLVLGWLIAWVALCGSALTLDVSWNLLNWHLQWDLQTIAAVIAAISGVAAIGYLAPVTENKVLRGVALVPCVLLAVIDMTSLRAEPLSAGMLGRTLRSPMLFNPLGNVFAGDFLRVDDRRERPPHENTTKITKPAMVRI